MNMKIFVTASLDITTGSVIYVLRDPFLPNSCPTSLSHLGNTEPVIVCT